MANANVLDIIPNGVFPSNELCNTAHQRFSIDGVLCSSREGVLQSFKTPERKIQFDLCTMHGVKAKENGSAFNEMWMEDQKLWWNGVEYDRHGQEYQDLLDKLFILAFNNLMFVAAITSSLGCTLTHSIGCTDPCRTVLTVDEFLKRIYMLQGSLDWLGV